MSAHLSCELGFTLARCCKSIRIAVCLSDISSGQVQVQSSLVNTMKLKDPDDEDEKDDFG